MARPFQLAALGATVVLALAAVPADSQCVLPPWSAGSGLGADVYGAAVASDGTFVYAAGGYSFTAGGDVNNFQRYDPASNSWTSLAPLPTAVDCAALTWEPVGNKLYLFGGDSSGAVLSVVQVYDVAGNSWSSGPAMPAARQQMGAGLVGGLIYLAGGYDTTSVSEQLQNWEFDPTGGTYTPRADLPQALGGPASVVADGLLYLIGGRDSVNAARSSVYAYNPGTDSWATLASLPNAENVAAAVRIPVDACGGDIVVAGGGTPFLASGASPSGGGHTRTTNITQIYDIATNSWSTGPNLTEGRSFAGAANVDDELVVVGGYNGATTVTTVDRVTAPIFGDGFESGSTSAWSGTVP